MVAKKFLFIGVSGFVGLLLILAGLNLLQLSQELLLYLGIGLAVFSFFHIIFLIFTKNQSEKKGGEY